MPKSENPRVKVGDNSGDDDESFLDTSPARMKKATDDRLRLLVERVERLEDEKKGVADDIRDTYAEAKALGYDAKIMRQMVKLRKMRPDDRAEMDALLETYRIALGIN
jgi:uncharacterized protein (UPF0335 family)